VIRGVMPTASLKQLEAQLIAQETSRVIRGR